MKWFKHMTDLRHDPFIIKLQEYWKEKYKRPMEAAGIYLRILELIAGQVNHKNEASAEFPLAYWLRECGMIVPRRFYELVTFCEKHGKLILREGDGTLIITCPNIIKIRDEYTSKYHNKPRECRDKLLTVSGLTPPKEVRSKEVKNKDNYKEKNNKKESVFFEDEKPTEKIDHGKHRMQPWYQKLVKQAKEIIEYLNKKCGTNIPTGRSYSMDLIVERLHEGRIKEEFIAIIDNKSKDPFFKKNRRLYTPKTLYSYQNFDTYLVEDSRDVEMGRENAPMTEAQMRREGIIK